MVRFIPIILVLDHETRGTMDGLTSFFFMFYIIFLIFSDLYSDYSDYSDYYYFC